jgi:outer membrane protein assembly factor BamD
MPLKKLVFSVARPWPHVALALALFSSLGLAGCASDDAAPADYVERPVEQIYADAWQELQNKNWVPAAKQFDEVERQHPYSEWARRATLMSAYCYYEANNYDEAIAAASRFISLHPGNKDVPYAYYLKAVSLYEQIVDVARDQQKTETALAALEDIVQRFPDTDYARDARVKIDLTHDHLAGKEMAIGRFYLRNGNYLAAINRFRIVVDRYQTTTQTPEALERLTEAYYAMGLKGEAQKTAAVLGYNYPDSEWYKDAYGVMQGERSTSATTGETDSPKGNAGAELKEDAKEKDGGGSWLSKAFDIL